MNSVLDIVAQDVATAYLLSFLAVLEYIWRNVIICDGG